MGKTRIVQHHRYNILQQQHSQRHNRWADGEAEAKDYYSDHELNSFAIFKNQLNKRRKEVITSQSIDLQIMTSDVKDKVQASILQWEIQSHSKVFFNIS